MVLTVEQALALAPDSAAAAAGRKLGRAAGWRSLGRSDDALWGECQGSALYQVRVALADLAAKCSCPSRKLPCKHSLGLLVLAASDPAALPTGEPPEWVGEWLARRGTRADQAQRRRGEQATGAEGANGHTNVRAHGRTDTRARRVAAGLAAFDQWLDDLVRGGLASLDGQPASFWEGQARRLVDAQAPGLAGRVRRLAAIPHATTDWPARLLDQLGRLALLSEAFRRLDALDPALQEDVRALLGWTLDADAVAARGETLRDDWAVVGQRVAAEERLRAQRSWLVGLRTGRAALVLQFAHGSAAFKEPIVPGTRLPADLTFWPSAAPQRALLRARHGPPAALATPPPGAATIADFLAAQAAAIARLPWRDRDLALLRGVVPVCGEPWLARDATGAALPIAGPEHWHLLAHSGGHPLDLAAEWDGQVLSPLGVFADGNWAVLPYE